MFIETTFYDIWLISINSIYVTCKNPSAMLSSQKKTDILHICNIYNIYRQNMVWKK